MRIGNLLDMSNKLLFDLPVIKYASTLVMVLWIKQGLAVSVHVSGRSSVTALAVRCLEVCHDYLDVWISAPVSSVEAASNRLYLSAGRRRRSAICSTNLVNSSPLSQKHAGHESFF